MTAWAVHGVELPFGDESASWWIDPSGAVHDRPVAAADPLPGGFVLPGLAAAHAHPAVGAGPAGLVALDASAAWANLTAWAQAGITLVRDVGSPRGLTLKLRPGPGLPAVQAAGRFLAPAGRYIPGLLDAPVDEAGLVGAALAEIGRGAAWVKVIATSPTWPPGPTRRPPTGPGRRPGRRGRAPSRCQGGRALHGTRHEPAGRRRRGFHRARLVRAGRARRPRHGRPGHRLDADGRRPGRHARRPGHHAETPARVRRGPRGSRNCCPWPSGSAPWSWPALT